MELVNGPVGRRGKLKALPGFPGERRRGINVQLAEKIAIDFRGEPRSGVVAAIRGGGARMENAIQEITHDAGVRDIVEGAGHECA